MRFVFLSLILVCFFTPAFGQLLDQTLRADWYYPDFGEVLESHTVVVSEALELSAATIVHAGSHEIDIGDQFVYFQFLQNTSWGNTEFNGWYFEDSESTLPPITGYFIEYVSDGIINPEVIEVGWSDDAFWANFAGLGVASGGDHIMLRVAFDTVPVESKTWGDIKSLYRDVTR